MKRRSFLKDTSVLAIGISLPGWLASCGPDQNEINLQQCETTNDILGPYYKAGSPIKVDIKPDGSTGIPLRVKGKVISDCDNPVSGAKVEIWNADENGTYDLSEEFLFRGAQLTDTNGNYSFLTILPGRYLNGSTFRPSHIHFLISGAGLETLISQVYFEGDEFNETDPWASDPMAKHRILEMVEGEDGMLTVNFDIYMNDAG